MPAAQLAPLQIGEVLLQRADDRGIAGIGEDSERVPEAEGRLQRAGVDVQAPHLGIRAPALRPEGAEVAAAAPALVAGSSARRSQR